MRKGSHHSSETIARMVTAGFAGRKHSDKTRAKMSVSQSGRQHSSLTIEKMRISATGRHLSAETIEKIRRKKTGVRHSVESKAHMSLSRKGEKNSFFGKHHSPETIERLRTASTGRRHSAAWCMRHSETMQDNNYSKGLVHSPKHRAKISIANKGRTPWMKGRHQSAGSKVKISLHLMGELNPNWQGGKSFEPYSLEWTRALKESIRDRDNHTCQMCLAKENGKKHDIHHIDYDKKNCDPKNLIELCKKPCHSLTNFNRSAWTAYFQEIQGQENASHT